LGGLFFQNRVMLMKARSGITLPGVLNTLIGSMEFLHLYFQNTYF